MGKEIFYKAELSASVYTQGSVGWWSQRSNLLKQCDKYLTSFSMKNYALNYATYVKLSSNFIRQELIVQHYGGVSSNSTVKAAL